MRLIYPVLDGQMRISQGFGPSQIDYSRWGLKGHNGIDFFGKAGDPILSVADGTVTWVGFEKDGYGNYIMIDIGDYLELRPPTGRRAYKGASQRVTRSGEGTTGNSLAFIFIFGCGRKNATE